MGHCIVFIFVPKQGEILANTISETRRHIFSSKPTPRIRLLPLSSGERRAAYRHFFGHRETFFSQAAFIRLRNACDSLFSNAPHFLMPPCRACVDLYRVLWWERMAMCPCGQTPRVGCPMASFNTHVRQGLSPSWCLFRLGLLRSRGTRRGEPLPGVQQRYHVGCPTSMIHDVRPSFLSAVFNLHIPHCLGFVLCVYTCSASIGVTNFCTYIPQPLIGCGRGRSDGNRL